MGRAKWLLLLLGAIGGERLPPCGLSGRATLESGHRSLLCFSYGSLYDVQMARFTATQARQNFARILDQAASGQPVTIERGKLRFRLVVESQRRAPRATNRLIEILDPAVVDGNWTWQMGKKGLSFKRQGKLTTRCRSICSQRLST
jgi:antitoxin (DNA-binding transcriptional repressor) of toxin-antitoxin stability system